MTAEEFVVAMLKEIRFAFFAKVSEKQFFQELHLLKQAITFPARWLKERGADRVTIGLMRKILSTVITAIKKHGDRANIGRFSVYFLHCVQGHMSHHGDDYLQEAKKMPPIGTLMNRAVAGIKAQAGTADPGAVLAETNRILGRKRRAIRKSSERDSAGDLFSSCSGVAKPEEKPGTLLKPLQSRPDPAISSQIGKTAVRDS